MEEKTPPATKQLYVKFQTTRARNQLDYRKMTDADSETSSRMKKKSVNGCEDND